MYLKFLALEQSTRNKIIAGCIISVTLLLVFYWYSYRPMVIKKECSVLAYYDSWEYRNLEYNEVIEKQKRQQLGEYIQCRNNNLVDGNRLDVSMESTHSFTQAQYEALPLTQLSMRILMARPRMLYTVYFNGYTGGSITNGWYAKLKDSKDKYPQCNFPTDFISEKIHGSEWRTRDASEQEYKTCLRKNGID